MADAAALLEGLARIFVVGAVSFRTRAPGVCGGSGSICELERGLVEFKVRGLVIDEARPLRMQGGEREDEEAEFMRK